MRITISAAALVAVMASGPLAYAAPISFSFDGPGVSSSGFLTVTPNTAPADPDSACDGPGANPCRTDPPGAYSITDITGVFSFSGSTFDISNATITGVVKIEPAVERNRPSEPFDPSVPSSLSFIDYGSGMDAGFLSYNNLFFPDGSPIDCAGFPFGGTLLDVYGLAFLVEGGYTVDLWGLGDVAGPGTVGYGIGVTDGTARDGLDGGVNLRVPEPASVALFGVGLVGLMARCRRSRRVGAPIA